MTSEHERVRVVVSLAPTPLRPDARPHWPGLAASWLVGAAPAPDGDLVDAALDFALQLGREHPQPVPGAGRTAELWETLATLAAADLGAARTIEPHLDALAILSQATATAPAATSPTPALALAGPGAVGATWGVFAAEGGTDPLTASPTADGAWTLTGTKPWCSLADRLDRALVSATIDTGSGAPSARRLFAVDLHHPGVHVEPGAWHARGLTEVPSGPVRFDRVPAEPVGAAGWYLERPGFAWGGIGVAACWFGGAVAVARTLFARAAAAAPAVAGGAGDPLLHMHLGAVDERLEDARRALTEAAALVDAGAATGDAGRLLAKRTRATVARAAEDVLRHVAHALGPAPLALDPVHAKRVADLELYLRQHHAEKDEASLGRQLAESTDAPW